MNTATNRTRTNMIAVAANLVVTVIVCAGIVGSTLPLIA